MSEDDCVNAHRSIQGSPETSWPTAAGDSTRQ